MFLVSISICLLCTQKQWYPFAHKKCLVDDLSVFRSTEGSAEHSPLRFGVEIVLWTTAAKKAGKRCPGGSRSSGTVHGQVARGEDVDE